MTPEHLALTCEEVEELLGAYALGALPDDELLAVDEHIDSCRLSDHRQLWELLETAALLPFTIRPAEPPADLGTRIVRRALAGSSTVDSVAPGENVVPIHTRRPSQLPYALAAAAMALIAIGLGVWGLTQHSALIRTQQAQQRQAAALALLDQAGTVLQTPSTATLPPALLLEPKGSGPAFLMANWPSPESGRTYQGWYLAEGRPVNAGVFGGSTGGLQIIQMAPLVPGAQAFAVTLEPSGGSAQPTTEPLFVRPLTSG
jgi:anti-sigma-K factor RskA